MTAYRYVNRVNKSLEKLASGIRINRAADDAAGLGISEKMIAQIRGLAQAGRNTQDAISLIQTAEGALNETHEILQRIRELSIQSSNGTYSEDDRKNIDAEVQQLKQEIDYISEYTNFNNIKLLNGNLSAKKLPPYITNDVNIPGERTDTIDFSTAKDGAVIIINGVSFEFDDDGILNDMRSNIVDISGLDNTQKGDALADAFNNSSLGADFYMLSSSTNIDGSPSEKNSITILGNNGTEIINVKYKPLPSSKIYSLSAKSTKDDEGGITIQVGSFKGHTLNFTIDSMSSESLGINDVKVDTADNAGSAITSIDNAINLVSITRANLGAIQNRFEHTMSNLAVSEENLTVSNSRIRDSDMAKEMMVFVKDNILTRVAQAMLSQANSQTQNALQLLI